MEIHYQSPKSVAIRTKFCVVSVNIPKKTRKDLKPDIILSTFPVPLAGWWEEGELSGMKVFAGAGEYEKNGVSIYGFGGRVTYDETDLQSTSYLVSDREISCLVLGAIAEKNAIKALRNAVEAADVLVVFCDENSCPSAAEVAGLAAGIGAQKIIPVGDDEEYKRKLKKEIGADEAMKKKYSIRKKSLSEQKNTVILFG